MLIRFDANDLLIGLVMLCICLVVLWQRKHNLPYLIFFSIFWIYMMVVVSIVIFPIAINAANASTSAPRINLIPFYSGYCSIPRYCLFNIVGNLLLTTPFGFGLSFLVLVQLRQIPWIAITTGLGFELSQLIVSLIFRTAFRSVDINDAMLNAIGVLVGYALFRGFAWAYLRVAAHFDIQRRWLFADVFDVAAQACPHPFSPPGDPSALQATSPK
jgi:glycopeptide antibiotics resistance protein